MAHKGHFGPVIFRRDFNLNVQSNDAGWLDGWQWFFRLLPGGVAHVLAGRFIASFPAKLSSVNSLLWRGPPAVHGARFWEVGLEVTIPPTGDRYLNKWTLYEATVNVVWQIDYTAPLDDSRRPRLYGAPSTTYYNPLYFDQKPNALEVFYRQMLWADYPT
jgi:hypothetical protein